MATHDDKIYSEHKFLQEEGVGYRIKSVRQINHYCTTTVLYCTTTVLYDCWPRVVFNITSAKDTFPSRAFAVLEDGKLATTSYFELFGGVKAGRLLNIVDNTVGRVEITDREKRMQVVWY